MSASLILLFRKTKASFGKDAARKNIAFLHTLFVENERKTSELKWGGGGVCFSMKSKATCKKKKKQPKKSLRLLMQVPLQLLTSEVFIL